MTKTSIELQDLRRRIYVKAKAEPSWRFWGLYVHVCKLETLREAYEAAKRNDGAPGIDGMTFEAIEAQGAEAFLEQIRGELVGRIYAPLPARRQEIPKDGGKVRVLSIPAIRDRVVQGALKLVLEPIFEADFQPGSFGYPRKVLANWSGIMQADAFSGYNALYEKGRQPAPVIEAACWAHGRRDFFDFAKLTKAPIAIEIVRRIDELFAIERANNGEPPEARRAVRQEQSKPLVAALEAYMREQLGRLSPKNDLAKAINYMLTRWPSFTRFLNDGRICLSNNAAERALRCVAVGRRNWTFAGSDQGASYCSSRHPLKSQRDFFGNSQTAAVATAERSLRAERSRAPTRHGGLSRARPCTAGSRRALFRRSIDARLRC